MKISHEALTVFPTELAKRRYELQHVLKDGVLDTSRLFTQKKLMDLCEYAARRDGFLTGKRPGEAELSLYLEETARSVRFASGQPLDRLSPAALTDLLRQAIERFAVFAEDEKTLLRWMTAHEATHKLHGIGQLLTAWRSLCTKMDIADRFSINTALLRFIESGNLPPELADGLIFRAVRWFNPFEERFAAALKTRLGSEQVQIVSVLPAAHAESAEDRLCAVVRSELMRSSEEEWKPWLEDFADAFEADDSNILDSDSSSRVAFFISAHPYGEIEDAARRIAREIESGTPPNQIALILRELSAYTDIVPDVFQRFGIPYHFRRGTPAAAHPPVKALLALLNFLHQPLRDRLCDLLLTPGIHWPGLRGENRQQLICEIRQNEPPRLKRLPQEMVRFFQPAPSTVTPSQFAKQIQTTIKQHELKLPEEVTDLITKMENVTARPLPPSRMLSLFENLLENVTLKDVHSTESGVWVINAMDAAGLRFESVYLAGMDDRTFPQIPTADGLLNNGERKQLRAFLEENHIPCPRLTLSEAGEALIQEEILFLTAMSAAQERLTLSYTHADADGKERAPGEFFERMRGLTQMEPELGDSFHTILPPEACRAEDEFRQTAAFASRQQPATPEFPAEQVLPLIQNWLASHPEFSATALETLARNRYVFFLEQVLDIRPDRTHEDDTDPMDRGSVIHRILEQVYSAIASQSGLYAKQTKNGWRLSQEGDIPLAVFDPAKANDLLTLAREITQDEFTKAEQRPNRHLGHPTVWETEKRKIRQIIENIVRMDLETAAKENRYPALFELQFGLKNELPVTLTTADEQVHLKGKIDRIDLIFDSDGKLQRLLVVDYKSRSAAKPTATLEKEIALNLDCQLPLYAYAAQQTFFGACNTPALNEIVQAVYHLQERDLKKMTTHFSRKRLTMTPELTNAFLGTLFANLRSLRAGDLATEPLIAHFEDYSHICRTQATDPKDLLKEV